MCTMLLALKREELMNRRNSSGIAGPNTDFPAPWPIGRCIRDHPALGRHDGSTRHGLRMHLERFREIARAKGLGNLMHVRANLLDVRRVRRVRALEHDAAAVRQILEHVRRAVLIHAHHMLAAHLHRGEIVLVLGAIARDQQNQD